ncbi:MAG: adenylate cyclase [Chloroflexota bacterium]
MSPAGIEIERKFRLRALPAPEVLAEHGAVPRRLEQVYLAGDPPGRRIRRIEHADGTTEHRLTRKERLREHAWREDEAAIDAARFETLLAEADPGRRPVRKTRYVVPHGTQHLEIDAFESPAGLVLLEVELEEDDEAIDLPAWVGEWREVTRDPQYLNVNLALADTVLADW